MKRYRNLDDLNGSDLVSEIERLAQSWGKAHLSPSETVEYLLTIEENGYKASVSDKARLEPGINMRYLLNAQRNLEAYLVA